MSRGLWNTICIALKTRWNLCACHLAAQQEFSEWRQFWPLHHAHKEHNMRLKLNFDSKSSQLFTHVKNATTFLIQRFSPPQQSHQLGIIIYLQSCHELGDKWQYMPWQSWHILSCDPLSLENRRLVTDEPVWVWGKNTSWSSRLPEIYRSFRGIYGRIYLEWRKQNHKMSTCN